MLKKVTVTFRSERGDEFLVNLEYEVGPDGKLFGEAIPTGIVTAHGQLLKQSYSFELPDGTTHTVVFERDRHNRVHEIDPK